MTCIVALKHNGKVHIGGDSAGTSGDDITVRKDTKVFHNGPFVMGFTDSFRMGDLLRYSLRVPQQDTSDSDRKFLITKLIPEIQQVFSAGGVQTKSNDVLSGGTFIIGYKGNIYTVYADYQVGEPSLDFESIGCGASYAMGSLFSSKHIEDPNKRIALALQAAEAFSTGVRRPFRFIKEE